MRRIPNVKPDFADRVCPTQVARGRELRTDAWTGYDDIGPLPLPTRRDQRLGHQ
jgi:hypothetical protein